MCGKGTQTTTTNNSPPPQVLAQYGTVTGLANNVAATPYQPYTGQLTAGVNAAQQGAISQMQNIGAATKGTTNLANSTAGAAGNLASDSLGAASTYAPYFGAAEQNLGAANQMTGAAAGTLGQASNYYAQGAQGVNAGTVGASQIAQYESPYTQDVINSTMANINQQNQLQDQGAIGSAIQAGNAFGGDRMGLGLSALANQQDLASGQTISNLENQGYTQALGEANTQQQTSLAAQEENAGLQMQAGAGTAAIAGEQGNLGSLQNQLATTQGNLGSAAQGNVLNAYNTANSALNTGLAAGNLLNSTSNTALNAANAQLAGGTLEQQTNQANLNAQYQQFQNQIAFPYQQVGWLGNISEGIGTNSGGTTTTQAPAPFFSDRRLKSDIKIIGRTTDGQPIYRFRYKGDKDWRVGLMAQDVLKKHPEAVSSHGGFLAVDYKKATDKAAKRTGRAVGGVIPPDATSIPGMNATGLIPSANMPVGNTIPQNPVQQPNTALQDAIVSKGVGVGIDQGVKYAPQAWSALTGGADALTGAGTAAAAADAGTTIAGGSADAMAEAGAALMLLKRGGRVAAAPVRQAGFGMLRRAAGGRAGYDDGGDVGPYGDLSAAADLAPSFASVPLDANDFGSAAGSPTTTGFTPYARGLYVPASSGVLATSSSPPSLGSASAYAEPKSPNANTANLNPVFADRIQDLQQDAGDAGIPTTLISGYRDPALQAQLYANYQAKQAGQALPYPGVGSGVMAAPPGQSYHNFGNAADVIANDPSQQTALTALAAQPGRGITPGATFGDADHYQIAAPANQGPVTLGGAAPSASAYAPTSGLGGAQAVRAINSAAPAPGTLGDANNPPAAAPAPAANDNGLFGTGIKISPEMTSALLKGVFGMLASPSHTLAGSIGTGGVVGVDQYMAAQAADRQNALAQSEIVKNQLGLLQQRFAPTVDKAGNPAYYDTLSGQTVTPQQRAQVLQRLMLNSAALGPTNGATPAPASTPAPQPISAPTMTQSGSGAPVTSMQSSAPPAAANAAPASGVAPASAGPPVGLPNAPAATAALSQAPAVAPGAPVAPTGPTAPGASPSTPAVSAAPAPMTAAAQAYATADQDPQVQNFKSQMITAQQAAHQADEKAATLDGMGANAQAQRYTAMANSYRQQATQFQSSYTQLRDGIAGPVLKGLSATAEAQGRAGVDLSTAGPIAGARAAAEAASPLQQSQIRKNSIMQTPGGPVDINTGQPMAIGAQGTAATEKTPLTSSTGFQVPVPTVPKPSSYYAEGPNKVYMAQAEKDVEGATAAGQSAMQTKALLGELQNDYNTIPPNSVLQSGAGGAWRTNFIKVANEVASLTGAPPVKDPAEVASNEQVNKIVTQLGVSVNKGLGREPGYILEKLSAMQPGLENTPQGNTLITAGLRATAQSAQDYADFMQRYMAQNGHTIGAQAAFNKEMPEGRYVQEAQTLARIPQTSVAKLQAKPQDAPKFDQAYGQGLSRYYLQ